MSVDTTYETLRARAEGSNVDPTTLLATDYLNHLNEPVMLLEMLPDMPDLGDELLAWQPKSYTEHFEESAIADRELAIEAYQYVPEQYRLPFEFTIRAVTRRVEALRDGTIEALAAEDDTRARQMVSEGLSGIHDLLGVANAIIHGCTRRDELHGQQTAQPTPAPMAEAADEDGGVEVIMSQDEIDSMFD